MPSLPVDIVLNSLISEVLAEGELVAMKLERLRGLSITAGMSEIGEAANHFRQHRAALHRALESLEARRTVRVAQPEAYTSPHDLEYLRTSLTT